MAVVPYAWSPWEKTLDVSMRGALVFCFGTKLIFIDVMMMWCGRWNFEIVMPSRLPHSSQGCTGSKLHLVSLHAVLTVKAASQGIRAFFRSRQVSVLYIPMNLGNKSETAYIAKKKTSVASIRERTIPTERPPLVGEVSVNFCG
jgi:hypothetical protein